MVRFHRREVFDFPAFTINSFNLRPFTPTLYTVEGTYFALLSGLQIENKGPLL